MHDDRAANGSLCRGQPAIGWLLLVLFASAGADHVLVNPMRNCVLDARAYYAAGRAVRSGVNPYDTPAVRAAVPLPGPQTLTPYLYPPPALAVAVPLSLLPYEAAQVAWCAFQFALMLAALAGLMRLIDADLSSPLAAFIAVPFLFSTPVTELFRWGQFDMLVLALLVVSLLALRSGRSAAGGAMLALATAAKLTPALYVVVLAVRGERRALRTAGLTLALLVVLSFAWPGPEACRQWIVNLSDLANSIPSQIAPQNMSLRGFLLRALAHAESPRGPSIPWINLGLPAARLVCTIAVGTVLAMTLAWLVCQRRRISTVTAIAATVPVALMVSPVTWAHHGVVLLVPLTLLSSAVLGRIPPRTQAGQGAERGTVAPCLTVPLAVAMFLYLQWPVQRHGVELAPWLAHLVGPTPFYTTLLVWMLSCVGLTSHTADQRKAPAASAGFQARGLAPARGSVPVPSAPHPAH